MFKLFLQKVTLYVTSVNKITTADYVAECIRNYSIQNFFETPLLAFKQFLRHYILILTIHLAHFQPSWMDRKRVRFRGAPHAECSMVGETHDKMRTLSVMSTVKNTKFPAIKKFSEQFVCKTILYKSGADGKRSTAFNTLTYFLAHGARQQSDSTDIMMSPARVVVWLIPVLALHEQNVIPYFGRRT
jgi:hypothetical protein